MSFSVRKNFYSIKKENSLGKTHGFPTINSTILHTKIDNKNKALEMQQNTKDDKSISTENEKELKEVFIDCCQISAIHGFQLTTEENGKLRKRPTILDSRNANKVKPLEMQQNNTKEDEKIPTEREKGLKDVLREWSQNTTIHGLRSITEDNVKASKRSIWIMLMLTCAGVLVWQIYDRVMHFYDRPIDVLVRLKYNNTLEFPLVTICNQNAFKATLAVRENRYKLLEKMFTSGIVFDNSSVAEFDASNISLLELYNTTAHNKEDFIFKCSYKGNSCTSDDFTRVMTDHGVCYTFDHRNTDRQMSSPGLENGLRLTLNVEQYEYMQGPHDAAGVKMLLHDPGEIPRVHAFGQAVPSGAHVFVGVKVLMVENLYPPHGKCDEKELHYAEKYSHEACELDCLTKFVEIRCKCREIYMPERNGYPPVCNLSDYYLCLQLEKERFKGIKNEQCNCPIKCNIKRYEPDISYGRTTLYAARKLLTPMDKTKLSTAVIAAREISSKFDDSIFQITKELSHRLDVTFHKEMNLLLVNISQLVIDGLIWRTTNMKTEIEEGYREKEYLYRSQIHAIERYFIRFKDVKEEKVIQHVYNGYLELVFTINNSIWMLANGSIEGKSARYTLYKLTEEKLKFKHIILQEANEAISEIMQAYENARPYLTDSPEDEDLNEAAIPKHLIHESILRQNGNDIKEILKELLDKTDCISSHLMDSYYNSSVDEDGSISCIEGFQEAMEDFYREKETFYHETVEWPKKQLEERHELFKLQWKIVSEKSRHIFHMLNTYRLQIIDFNNMLINPLKNINSDLNDYVHGDSLHKYNLCKMITSSSINVGIVELQTFYNNLISREKDALDWLNRMQREVNVILEDLYQDEDAVAFYSSKKLTKFLRDFRLVMDEVDSNFTQMMKLAHFREPLNHRDEELKEALNELVMECKRFLTSVDINRDFIRDNFMNLDIFFREMSYDEIQQQIAYDVFALFYFTVTDWMNISNQTGDDKRFGITIGIAIGNPFFSIKGDVGGAMGLFLGASFLSFCELIDVLYDLFKKQMTKRSCKRCHR